MKIYSIGMLLLVIQITYAQDRVGLYSGTFDPIHLGHLHVIELAIKNGKLDRVYIHPNLNPLHKKPTLSFKDRFELIKVAIKSHPQMIMPEFNILKKILNTKEPNASLFKWVKMQSPPNTKYFRIMGADSFQKYLQYSAAIDALKNTPNFNLIVAERPGHNISVPEHFKSKVIIINSVRSLPYSSSQYKNNPKKNEYMLPKEVAAKIRENGFYGVKTDTNSMLQLIKSIF